VLQVPSKGFESLEECYGTDNLDPENGTVRLVTIAPEQDGALEAIKQLSDRGVIASIGHSTTTYEISQQAFDAGAKTITHLFNAMNPLHHRNPGVFGLLGSSNERKPFFGIIADGIHLHPTSINIAYNAHPAGLILVTDAMFPAGLPDGVYDWTNDEKIEKKGHVLTLVGTDGKIAGSSATLIDCINNFLAWTNATVPEALNAVTKVPAKLLGIQDFKGCLNPGADADLVILAEETENGETKLKVDQVWKFGEMVFDSSSLY
jgi:N-acetylglucosamine-6-phosphate deacetylase